MKGDKEQGKKPEKDKVTKKDGRQNNKGNPNNKGGRPKKELNVRLLNELCIIQCTGTEIAAVLGMHYDTLNEKIKAEFGMSFPEYFEQKRELGKTSLRRKQWKLADKNPAMAIFLGKQILGQKDKFEVDSTNTNTNTNLNLNIEMPIEEADMILKEFGISFEKPDGENNGS